MARPGTIVEVKTVVLGPRPDELEHLIQRRRAQGLDTFDEVWEGSYHMAPAGRAKHAYLDDVVAVLLHPYARAAGLIGTGPFNLGPKDDYRVPDRGYHLELPDVIYLDTAAVVVEIVSPDDETYAKLPFYADHGVDEVVVVEPDERRVRIFSLEGGHYTPAEQTILLAVTSGDLGQAINWL